MDLTLVWAAILALGVIIYVILDGFDLGIGILFPLIKNQEHRHIMMDTVAPVWDGNETWLVLGGALLYGAFPPAYSHLLPVLYLPIMLMLVALIFRGIAFEFRPKAHRSRWIWDIAFAAGSIFAGFFQGVILGAFIEGHAFTGAGVQAYFAWLSPFSIMTGVAVVVGYGLLGVTWLIAKTEGELQQIMYRFSRYFFLAIGLFLALVSLVSPVVVPRLQQLWFSLPNFFYLLPLPVATLGAYWLLWRSLQKQREFLPFYLSISLFIFAYVGLCISAWPYIVPGQLTIWDAAAPENAQIFLLIGTAILLPVLLGYTAFTYRIFAGKVKKGGTHYD